MAFQRDGPAYDIVAAEIFSRHGAGPEQPLDSLWRRVDAAVSDVIDRTTFGDLVRVWRESQARYVPNWEI